MLSVVNYLYRGRLKCPRTGLSAGNKTKTRQIWTKWFWCRYQGERATLQGSLKSATAYEPPIISCVSPYNECVGWAWEGFHGQMLHLYSLFSEPCRAGEECGRRCSAPLQPARQTLALTEGGCLYYFWWCWNTMVGSVLPKKFWLLETGARNPRQVFI